MGLGLLERSGELAMLRERIELARGGTGSVVVIEGPAGIGKTSLLEAGCGLGAEAGLRVLRARAGQLEAELAWGLVRQLYAAVIGAPVAEREALLSGAAALAAPALGLGDGAEAGTLHGLYWLTASLAESGPLLLCVDDAQWGDPASLRLLAYLANRLADLPLTLLVASRGGGRAGEIEELAALAAHPYAELLAPRELSRQGSAALVRDALSAAADPFCDACHEASGGNPFLLRELVAQLRRDHVAADAAGAARVRRTTPATVERSVLLRLGRLPEAARELAVAIAVLEEPETLAQAAALAGLERAAAEPAVAALDDAGVIAGLAFVHPIVREVIHGELAPPRRARLHREAARLLGDGGADVELVASHLLEAEPDGDPWTVARLREAAAKASAEGAPSLAATALERALREGADAEDRAELLIELGRAELSAGRGEASERLREAMELIDEPRRRAVTLNELGSMLQVAGKPLEAVAAHERARTELAAVGEADSPLADEIRARWLVAARLNPRPSREAVRLIESIAADPPPGETHGERALLAQVAGQLTLKAKPREDCLRLARLALADGELLREETSEGVSWLAAMGALCWCGDFDSYESQQQVAIADARRRGSVVGFATATYGLIFSHFHRGRLTEALADAQIAIDAKRDGWSLFLPGARAQLAWALVERGDLEGAAAALELAHDESEHMPSPLRAMVLEAEARIHLARGSPRAALEAALEAGRVFEETMIDNPSIVPWRASAALAAARLGEMEMAERLLAEGLAVARGFGAPRPIGVALAALGAVRGAAGVEPLREAVATLAASPARLEQARALVGLGASLRRHGAIREARESLREGLDLAAELGATAIAERAETELRESGARPRRRRARGADALTPAEERVARSAAEGMSNREIAEALFVSLRTVETHLTHSYSKLGIASRDELATALRTRD